MPSQTPPLSRTSPYPDVRTHIELDRLEQERYLAASEGHYDEAAQLRKKYLSLRQQIDDARRECEVRRQSHERTLLDASKRIAVEQFHNDWEQKLLQLHDSFQQRLQHLNEVHESERAHMERDLSRRPQLTVKYSKHVLEMLDLEKKLALHHRYEEAKEVQRRLQAKKTAEEEAVKEEQAQVFQRHRRLLHDKQDAEVRSVLRKHLTLAKKFELDKRDAYALLQQSLRNLDSDMKHAHALEYIAPVQPDITRSVTKATALDKSATFRGSQLRQKLSSPPYQHQGELTTRLPPLPLSR